MNAQPTPGPWEAKGTAGHQTYGQWAVYDAHTGKDIAIVYDGAKHAVLIAAAPDLLAACQTIAACASAAGPHGTTAYFISAERMQMLRAAIAKASQPTTP